MLILTKFTNAFEGVISMWVQEMTINETGWNIMNKCMGCMEIVELGEKHGFHESQEIHTQDVFLSWFLTTMALKLVAY